MSQTWYTTDKTMQICNKARAEHQKHLDNLCGSQTSSWYWGFFSSRIKWPDCEADHLPNMVQRCVIVASSISISGIILGHRKKCTLINGTSNLTHTVIPRILLYLLTYLLKLAKCIMFFQDELVWCWHSQVQCMSVEVHYHSHHSWQIQLPDLRLNLTHSYNIKIEIQMYIRLYNEHYFLFRWHGH